MDTIFAQATAPGKAGVAVVRVSGPRAFAVAEALAGAGIEERRPTLRRLRDAQGAPIDEALVLVFGAGRSFTGEPVVEFQTHGSVAVVDRLYEVIGAMEDCRVAAAGEFTRRAFENGRLDLAQVEGLAALIDAETETQRKLAGELFAGKLGTVTTGLRSRLLRARALIEATIDFADEEVPVDVTPEVRGTLEGVIRDLDTQIAGAGAVRRVREGFTVALVGAPNVGKSSLMNAIAGRDISIVSEVAGTTRDVIECRVDLGGLAVTFLDLAGLREARDGIERIGVERAIERRDGADLRVFLFEGAAPERIEGLLPGDLVERTKADLGSGGTVSAITGMGVDRVLADVRRVLSDRSATDSALAFERHRVAFEQALGNVQAAVTWLGRDDAVAAEFLREATTTLDTVVGAVGVEDVLGEIFSSFCIGK
ncbi:MAG: tRNA uridine-5-carboxymethylaminomethyl(34) synthesis GTPase MnmE [Shimia sp.]